MSDSDEDDSKQFEFV